MNRAGKKGRSGGSTVSGRRSFPDGRPLRCRHRWGRRDHLDLAADCRDLRGEAFDVDTEGERGLLAQRYEEVVVVAHDHLLGREALQDSPRVVLGELAAGDPAEEQIDAAVTDLVLDQVGRALVVDRVRAGRQLDASADSARR